MNFRDSNFKHLQLRIWGGHLNVKPSEANPPTHPQEIAGPPKKGSKKRDKKVIHKLHNPLIRPIFLHRFSAHAESKQEVHNLLINLISPVSSKILNSNCLMLHQSHLSNLSTILLPAASPFMRERRETTQ